MQKTQIPKKAEKVGNGTRVARVGCKGKKLPKIADIIFETKKKMKEKFLYLKNIIQFWFKKKKVN